MTQNQLSGWEAREALLKGVRSVAIPVTSTLGPAGKTVALTRFIPENGFAQWAVHPTKDGATVAKYVAPQKGEENIGALIIKQSALETAIVAGDGTTSSTALAWYMAEMGIQAVAQGANPHLVKKGMEVAMADIIQNLKEQSKPVTSREILTNIAYISANSDSKIADHVASAYSNEEGGLDFKTTVILTKSKDIKPRVERLNGMRVDCSTWPIFYNVPRKQKFIAQNAVVVITNEEVSEYRMLEKCAEFAVMGQRPLVVIANKFIGEAFGFLQQNAAKNNICAVELSAFGVRKADVLRDIAILTGGFPLGTDSGRGILHSNPKQWGTATSFEIGKDGAVIINEYAKDSEIYQNHVESLESSLEQCEDPEEKKWIEERLSNIQGNIALIHVGANTESEALELFDRYEDSVLAVKSALNGGYVAGGGAALAKAYSAIWNVLEGDDHDFDMGYRIVQNASLFPLEIIYRNANKVDVKVRSEKLWRKRMIAFFDKWFKSQSKFDSSISQVTEFVANRYSKNLEIGYNALTNDFCNLLDAGIIDPVIVPQTAIKNAVSASSILIATEHLVVNT